jgi:cardiolipin synthase
MNVDEGWSPIGSANRDMRPLRLNFEITLSVCCPIFGKLAAAAIAKKQDNPVTLKELHARSLPARLRDSAVRLMLPYL